MKVNKVEMHAKKSLNDFSNTLFGIITKIGQARLKKDKIVEDIYSYKQIEQVLKEAEVQKGQATELVRRFQNC